MKIGQNKCAHTVILAVLEHKRILRINWKINPLPSELELDHPC